MNQREEEALYSTIMMDDMQDIRRVLRMRGIEPNTLDEAPECDICTSWKATHVQTAPTGTLFLVCDKPRCQDKVAELGEGVRYES